MLLFILAAGLLQAVLGYDVPAVYIFGDSTVDCGNNNKLSTIARSNYHPYGMNFARGQATGRFTDGYLSVDYLSSYLGIPLIPAYLEGGDFSNGVNFASAGAGIFNSTGDIFGEHISLEQQLGYFRLVKQDLIAQKGLPKAANILSKSLYYISIGSNDYINNYYMSLMPFMYSTSTFNDMLISSLSEQIKALYNEGARKIIFASLSPLGRVPSQLFKFGSLNGRSITFLNNASQDYNHKLIKSMDELRNKLSGVYLIQNNAYDLILKISENPKAYGMESGDKACCGVGDYGGAFFCIPGVPVCQDPSKHVFWDEFHPSEATYRILASHFWEGQGSMQYSFPMTVKELVQLNISNTI